MKKENNIYDSLSYKIVMSVTEEYARKYDVDTEGTSDCSSEIITDEQARNVIANSDECQSMQGDNPNKNNNEGINNKSVVILIVIAIVAVIGFIIFANNKKDIRHGYDSTEIADSVGDITEMPTENTEEEDAAVSETPDLLSFGLKGPVRKVSGKGLETLEFDKKGRIVRVGEFNISYSKSEDGTVHFGDFTGSIKRGTANRIASIGPCGEASVNMGYDHHGNLVSYSYQNIIAGYDSYEFTYNDEGVAISSVCKAYDVGYDKDERTDYSDWIYDKYGNWICRSYKTVATIEKEGDFDETEDGEDTESSPVKNTQTTHGVQRRNISYYP